MAVLLKAMMVIISAEMIVKIMVSAMNYEKLKYIRRTKITSINTKRPIIT